MLSPLFRQQYRGLKTISVVGGGLMGSGIAQTGIQCGYNVHLIDVKQDVLVHSETNIHSNLKKIAEKKFPRDKVAAEQFQQSCLAKLHSSTELKPCISQSDLIIEAIVENLDAKKSLFRLLSQHSPEHCIFASNTSSISLHQICPAVNRTDRFGGLHFFNPVPIMALVEVVRTEHTSDVTFRTLLDFCHSLGKTPIECVDTPGFVVNRLLVPFLLEAVRMVERGEATKWNVDTGMKLGAGHPMGPLQLADFVGLDTLKLICDSFSSQLTNAPMMKAPDLLVSLVASGKLGRKSGEGFFKYDARGKLIDAN